MRIIYTACFNNYDTVQPITLPQGWRALLFTDSHQPVKGWEIVPTNPEPKIFRKIKICPHLYLPPHELSVWMDGNLHPKMPLNHIVSAKTGYWLMSHPSRRNIFDEGKRCIELRKDDADIINAQLDSYRAEGYPETKNSGLVATGVLIRSGDFTKFSEMWWEEVEKGSVRDQLSWNYCQWKTKLKYKMFPFLSGFQKVIHTGKSIK